MLASAVDSTTSAMPDATAEAAWPATMEMMEVEAALAAIDVPEQMRKHRKSCVLDDLKQVSVWTSWSHWEELKINSA